MTTPTPEPIPAHKDASKSIHERFDSLVAEVEKLWAELKPEVETVEKDAPELEKDAEGAEKVAGDLNL